MLNIYYGQILAATSTTTPQNKWQWRRRGLKSLHDIWRFDPHFANARSTRVFVVSVKIDYCANSRDGQPLYARSTFEGTWPTHTTDVEIQSTHRFGDGMKSRA